VTTPCCCILPIERKCKSALAQLSRTSCVGSPASRALLSEIAQEFAAPGRSCLGRRPAVSPNVVRMLQRPWNRQPSSAPRGLSCGDAADFRLIRPEQKSRRPRGQRRFSGHENSSRRSSRSGSVLAGHRAQGIVVVENAVGHAGLDDGLRAREIRWRPLRLARVPCERESVCVVRPLVLRSPTE
jgi:hypothetical protein